MKRIVFILFLTLFISSCFRVPITNRKQFNLLNEKDLINMSEVQYAAMMDSLDVLPDTDPRAKRVLQVGENIQDAVEKFMQDNGLEKRIEGFAWEYKTAESDMLNAWCMPGGKVCFYTGILELTDSDDEIAVIMGHEIAHAIARHGNERMSQQLALAGIAGLTNSSDSTQTQSIYQRVFMGSATLGMLKFSRMHESESDKLGLVFMKMAGYDPTKAIDFWEKMAAQSGFVPEILSTHPSDEKRIEDITAFLEEIDNFID